MQGGFDYRAQSLMLRDEQRLELMWRSTPVSRLRATRGTTALGLHKKPAPSQAPRISFYSGAALPVRSKVLIQYTATRCTLPSFGGDQVSTVL